MLAIDLRDKRAFIAGIADDHGYGWAIAKALSQAGASVCAGTWPPMIAHFERALRDGQLDTALPGGGVLRFEKVYPLDALYDHPEDVPSEVRRGRGYADHPRFTVHEVAAAVRRDTGRQGIDVLVHSLANAPEVKKPLLTTTRKGYLAALSASSYSLTSLVQHFAPLFRPGASVVSLSYLAAARTVPGYGGGMHAAKAALEADTRELAYEAGRRFGVRVNAVSPGPLLSRAAKAIGKVDRLIAYYGRNSALGGVNTAEDVGNAVAFLASPLAAGIAGVTLYVDRGYHAMGLAPDVLRESAD